MQSSQAQSGTSTPNGPSMVSMEMCGHPLSGNVPTNMSSMPIVSNNNGTNSVQMMSQQQIAQLTCSQPQQIPPPQLQQHAQQYSQHIQRNPPHFQQQGYFPFKVLLKKCLGAHPVQNANVFMTNQNLNYQQSLLQQPQYLHYYSPQTTIMHPPPNTGIPQQSKKIFLTNIF